MQKPTSDAHSNTYLINANFGGISFDLGITNALSQPIGQNFGTMGPQPNFVQTYKRL
jgi:hypothetical protein